MIEGKTEKRKTRIIKIKNNKMKRREEDNTVKRINRKGKIDKEMMDAKTKDNRSKLRKRKRYNNKTKNYLRKDGNRR